MRANDPNGVLTRYLQREREREDVGEALALILLFLFSKQCCSVVFTVKREERISVFIWRVFVC